MQGNTALSILQKTFGYNDFRGRQSEIIDKFTSGTNILAVMPTGAGKSICFQIPALMGDGLTIVISPLIALMQNQVEALKILGIEAASINSSNTPSENSVIWRKMQDGTLKILYLSPEKLMTSPMLDAVDELNVNFFAIDEAHCISQWGAAFRPEYADLSILHVRYPHVPIIALTATADQGTRDQICERIFSNNVDVYLDGFDRPNITLNVEIKNGWKQQLLRFLKGRNSENGIVYCLSRKKTEEAAKALNEKGYNACAYHAGMPANVRSENLNRFMTEDNLIMVATIAFGMGIDKSDIRFVFHTDLPATPEAYYQEIGRAGRDGEPAVAHMLYGMDDIRMRRMFIDNEAVDQSVKMRGHQRLNSLLSYCEAPECRRVTLLHYFGDIADYENCGNCDLCINPAVTIEGKELAQKMLSAIYRSGQTFGIGHVADILIGKNTDKIEQFNHDYLPTFGIGKELHVNEWKSIARQMMARAFLEVDMEYGAIKITDKGIKLLKGTGEFKYRPDVKLKAAPKEKRKKPADIISELSEEAQDLFAALKLHRMEIAKERSVPAYIIFSDKSLIDMAVKKPKKLSEFGDVFGVGAGKKKEFGKNFVKFIKENS